MFLTIGGIEESAACARILGLRTFFTRLIYAGPGQNDVTAIRTPSSRAFIILQSLQEHGKRADFLVSLGRDRRPQSRSTVVASCICETQDVPDSDFNCRSILQVPTPNIVAHLVHVRNPSRFRTMRALEQVRGGRSSYIKRAPLSFSPWYTDLSFSNANGKIVVRFLLQTSLSLDLLLALFHTHQTVALSMISR